MPEYFKDLEINVSYNSIRDKWVSINGEYFNKDEAFDFAMMLLRASSEILESLDRDITDNLKGKWYYILQSARRVVDRRLC